MSFDPTKPVDGSPLDAVEICNQLNALNDKITAQGVLIAALQAQLAAKATAIPNVALFDTNIPYHTPIEPGDFDPLYNKMNEVITALQS